MSADTFDPRICKLGEGPLWHPERNQLFWFDIMARRMLSQNDGTALEWQFEDHVSAAGWIDAETLLIATSRALIRFDLDSGQQEHVIALEADNPVTRSNDGRADPRGGFWIGTMGLHAEPKAGAIYRFHRGELRQIVPDITVSNTLCFAPDGTCVYYSDTPTQLVMRLPLHPDTGWPDGAAEVVLDLREEGLNPDGAVTDAQGNLWIAEWGAARVACYDPDGQRLKVVAAHALQCSCPAFGGPDLRDLYITSANVGLSAEEKSHRPLNGATFLARSVGQGRPEPRVVL